MQPQVILITGASSGFGKITAQMLSERGHIVYGTSRKPSEDMNQVKMLVVDVTNSFSVCQAVERILSEQGRIDVLINNAGIGIGGALELATEEEVNIQMNTNFFGVVNMCKAVLPSMRKARKGKIINISSVSGLTGNPGQANYSASKAGVIGLTKSVAKELASRGVCCNAIAPGFIATEMTQALENDTLKDAIPMKRFGEAEEVAKLALFLASEHSDYITGEVIRIDGGLAC